MVKTRRTYNTKKNLSFSKVTRFYQEAALNRNFNLNTNQFKIYNWSKKNELDEINNSIASLADNFKNMII